MSFRSMSVAMVGLLPPSALKNAILRRLGWSIGRYVSIGPGAYLNLSSVSLGDNARIGPFNVIRDLNVLQIGDYARIGQWNWITAAKPLVIARGGGRFGIGDHSALTARHYVDCSGGVDIGRYTTVAGVRSTFISHGINWKTAEQTSDPIRVGDYCILSSNLAVTPGTEIADGSVVGMGATISGRSATEGSLLIGSRAQAVRSDIDGAYFSRAHGFIARVQEGRV